MAYLAGAERLLARTSVPHTRLRRALEQLHDYDSVLIHCPPTLGVLTVNALAALRGGVSPADVCGPADFVLRSQAALDVAAATVWAAMSPCHGCDCGGL